METNSNTTIYWSLLKHKNWNFYIASTNQGLCYVGSQNKLFAELADWTKKNFPVSQLVQNNEKLEPYATEIIDYLEGNRKTFTSPLDYKGTEFQVAVWNALRDINYGETKSYSDIANYINNPQAVRAVGAAIGANPVLITIPCHRVVGKNGSLTGYRGGLEMKKQLLAIEKNSLVN